MQCPVCFSDSTRSTSRISREGFPLNIIECKNCGHFSQPDEDYEEIYTTGEFSQSARNQRTTPSDSKIKELDKRALKRIRYYSEYIHQMDEVLEIGSSIGSFVHTLKLQGKSAYGLEPDPDYSHYAETQYGFGQSSGLLEEFSSEKEYGAVCSFHVLEHVRDPHQFVKKCHDLLGDGGKLLFEFPSLELHMYGSMKETIWKPHIHYFTRASVYHLFSQYFKVLTIGYYGSALFIFAEKRDRSSFKKSIFKQHKRRAKRISTFIKLVPQIPIQVSTITAKQLVMQSLFFQRNRKELLLRFFTLGFFAIKNKLYLSREKGVGSKKVTHFSYHSGWENAGDTVLSKTVRDNFNVLHKNSWDLKKVTNPVTENVVAQINKNDYMVIGGGGLLLPDSNPNAISGWQWAISEEFLEEINVPIIVYAIGYNFFIGQKPEELFIKNLKSIVDHSSFFSLRNSGSIKAVSELVGKESAQKINYQPCPTTVIRKVDRKAPEKRKTKNVGVNIAYDRYHLRYGSDIYTILDQVAIALKEIENNGYSIYNICHLENDKKFELTLDAHGVDYQSINLQYSLPHNTYETYCNMELVMGTRGHAQMIPFGLNTKIISLGSHNKLRWFLEDINALDWFVDLKEDVNNISDKITGLFFSMVDSTQVDERIEAEQAKLYQVTEQNYDKIGVVLN